MLNILGELRETGIAIVSGQELLGKETCDALDAYLFAFRDLPATRELQAAFERGEVRSDVLKPHMVKTDQVGCDRIQLASVACCDPVARVIFDYLGPAGAFHSANGWYFFPRPYDRQRVWSESWHRDPEESQGRLLKAFYWPEKVCEESGPFQCIPASRIGGPLESLCPPKQYPKCDVDSLVHPNAIVTCDVEPRTFMFVDSSMLHRGGFTRSRHRLCATWCYVKGKS